MPRLHIDSLDDPRLEPYRQLKDSNATRWAGLLIAEGSKLVERLLASRLQVVSILIGEKPAVRTQLPAAENVPVYVLADQLVSQLVGYKFHHGMLACARRPPSASLAELCGPSAGPLTLVVCPDVQDPENLGSILRTASALGVDGMLLGSGACDPFSRRVLRVSMGAALGTRIRQSEDLADDLQALRGEHGVELWAAVLDEQATPLADAVRPRRLALLLGSEGHGLSPEMVGACDRSITIPMQSGVDSLNVGVAAGIILYYLASQE